ncbi:MAG: hypothetical protein E7393_03245 [Ruminococcaceae bacterium]|nr:hypothetical protein [Oscillospiraceae bacterium]
MPREQLSIGIGTSKSAANTNDKITPSNPMIIINFFFSFKANLNAARDVYPNPIAAPIDDISTIHPRAVLPTNGENKEITIINIIAFLGVLLFASSFAKKSR